MNKKAARAALAALIAASTLPVSACAATLDDRTPAGVPAFNTADHMQYMNGYADGTFRPDAHITRAEACQLIAGLLAESSGGADYLFTDVPNSAWYADAVRELCGFSLLSGYADGTFRPDATITRAEFVTLLARFPHDGIGVSREFTDVPASHWAHEAVQTALAQGWTGGYPDGTFRPDARITRAEAVTMLGRVLGREGDAVMAATGDGIRVMPDVPDTHWAYLAMLEATTDHTYEKNDGRESWLTFEKETTPLAAGWHNIGGELFHVNDAQQFDRGTVVGGLTLDRNGRYTTGNAELDKLLTAAAAAAVGDRMTQPEKLRAMYDYAKQHFGYLGIGTVDTTQADWDIAQATSMLQTGKGNCYSWAASFTHLARKVGYDAKVVVGKGVSPKGNESVHAWTEITLDGTPYTFDPQIESVYAARYGEHYDLYMKKYGEAVWGYKADEAQAPEEPAEPEADAALASLMETIYADTQTQSSMVQTVLYPGMGADGQGYELSYFLGTNALPIETGLASEPMISVHPHSIVLARFAEGTDMEAVKKTVAENADPYKWICVGVEPGNVKVDAVGNTLILIMDNDNAQTYLERFQKAAG